MDHRDRRNYFILGGLLVLLGGLFVLRGPVRAVQGGSDFIHLYAAAGLWAQGGNPYDGQACVDFARQAGFDRPEHVADGSFYPPPTLATLAPLGAMGWQGARLAWLGLNLLSCGVLVWALASWLAVDDRATRWMLAGVLVLAWGPIATTLSLGQLALTVCACVCAGALLLQRGRDWQAGLLIALACLIKPQLGLGFFALLLVMRAWRASAVTACVIAAVSILGIVRINQAVPDWSAQLTANLALAHAPGGMVDASSQGALRFQMIDLRPLLHLALPGSWVGVAALLLTGLLAALALARLLRLGLRGHLLLAVSGVAVLLMLPVYHRYYDAVLLLPVLALLVNRWRTGRCDVPWWLVTVGVLPLFVAVPAVLARLDQRGRVPDALIESAWFQGTVMQAHSWSVLLIAIGLVWWVWRLPLPQGEQASGAASG